ncbi:hypothetical protein Cva_01408 [Caedimonas varicaedens]|jgi:hypothetical protein|uniref:Uncharacterized protein n=1 Tax=Caedimonas varicaedens TaxID=1629334 RepID=A0A0K8MDW9_9PROT|nr:hypothetical protein Cva_01408 [Caedimonas varicaedens]
MLKIYCYFALEEGWLTGSLSSHEPVNHLGSKPYPARARGWFTECISEPLSDPVTKMEIMQ